jgi:POT family proton-dependent oligopeptide transporter
MAKVAGRPRLPPSDDRAFFGHPRGLSTLFFTEMWERFSYYGMRALLILFMTAATAKGGLGFDTATAGALYGLYTSMVYLASLPGGWIADRLLGQRRAVLYGGILIACGHYSMAVPWHATFFLGLVLIVFGTGLLKSNISVLVGQLYAPDDHRRDAGFSLYYMGINLGAFLSPLVCGYLGQRINWHAGFAAAGVGMTCGLVQYVLGGRHLGNAGIRAVGAGSPARAAALERRLLLWGSLLAAVVALAGLALYSGVVSTTAFALANAAGSLLLITTAGFFAWLFLGGRWTPAERKRLVAISVFFVAAALFWSEFEQGGSTLNLFADRDTTNVVFGWTFPSSWYQSVNALFIIAFAPVFAWLWVRLGRREPSSPVKFSFGLMGAGTGFLIMMVAALLASKGVKVSPDWLIATYLVHTFAELCLSPVGLSAMTKLAPARVAGLMMGVWFLATSVGDFLAGRLASFYETFPLPNLFGLVAVFGIVAGLAMLAVARPIERLMGEVK